MMRLRSRLLSLNADKATKVKVYSPANTEELRIPFRVDKTAKVVGKLAQIPPPKSLDPEDGQLIQGVLVQNDFKLSLMAPDDLREYAGLNTTTVKCKQRITLSAAGIDLIRWALEGTFGSIETLNESGEHIHDEAKANGNGPTHNNEDVEGEIFRPRAFAFMVMGCVIVRYENQGELTVEWEGNILNDGIADAVMAVLLSVETSPAAVKRKRPATSPQPPPLTLARILETAQAQPRSWQESSREHYTRGAILSHVHVPRSSVRTQHDAYRDSKICSKEGPDRRRHEVGRGRGREHC